MSRSKVLNACVRCDRGRREAANLSKAAALRIGEEAGHGEIKAWAWETPAWSETPSMPAAPAWADSPGPTTPNTTSSSTPTSGTSTRWTPTVSSETTNAPQPTPDP
ncbi:hypothetical protein [Streptomyces sp. NPDC059168]|uniref:hypothetical protein n=1 Tax=Streptomyces sp. NPDC059168 TaxID=3346753 RepID=UPI0036C2B033